MNEHGQKLELHALLLEATNDTADLLPPHRQRFQSAKITRFFDVINDIFQFQECEQVLFKRILEFALGGPFGNLTWYGQNTGKSLGHEKHDQT